MSIRFDIPTLDAADSRALAAFWAELLGLVVREEEEDGRWVLLGTPEGQRVLGIQRTAETVLRSVSSTRK